MSTNGRYTIRVDVNHLNSVLGHLVGSICKGLEWNPSHSNLTLDHPHGRSTLFKLKVQMIHIFLNQANEDEQFYIYGFGL